MNAERLLAHYERIADAPQAVPRLRRFVLDLAVRGKLVAQDVNDEPASQLLKRIKKGKEDTPTLALEAEPIELPNGWCAAPLIALGTWAIGAGFPKTEQGRTEGPFMFLKVSDMNLVGNEKYITVANNFIDERAAQRIGAKIHPPGTIIFPKIGGAIATNKRRILTIGAAIDNNCLGITFSSQIDTEWAYLLLTALDFTHYQAGTAVPALQQGTLGKIPISLPSLGEQRRIVSKVNELMALCDRLERARTEREATRDRFTTASLARLNAPDPDTFSNDARFVLDALPALTTRCDQIKQLRQTILNLAVRGRLIPQDPNDEPAAKLLKRIDAEFGVRKQRYVETNLAFFDLPTNWRWTHLGRLVSHSEAGWSPKTEDHPREGDNWGVLKVSAVSWDKFRPWENKQVLPGTEPRLQAAVGRGDFLISRANTAELIARAVIVEDEPINLMMSDKIVRLHLSRNCDHRFVWIVNNYAEFAREHYVRHASGVSPSMKNVSRDVILGLPFPLPPLDEQLRIVAKVDELMELCDRLEASLTTADNTRSRLLEALLAEALTPVEERELEAAE